MIYDLFWTVFRIKNDIKATKTYSRPICNNKDCKSFNVALQTEFCPHCGNPSFKKEIVDFVTPDFYKMTNGALTKIERFKGKFIVITNCEVANLNSFHIDEYTQEFNYILEKFSYEKEVEFFKNHFKKKLKKFLKNFTHQAWLSSAFKTITDNLHLYILNF